MKLNVTLALAFGMALVCGPREPTHAQDVPLPDVAERCASLCQAPDEPWRTIPWQTDLIAAQHLAVEQNKPIFIWAMDGHPLGCT